MPWTPVEKGGELVTMHNGQMRDDVSWQKTLLCPHLSCSSILSQTFAQTFADTYSINNFCCQESPSLRVLPVYEGPNS